MTVRRASRISVRFFVFLGVAGLMAGVGWAGFAGAQEDSPTSTSTQAALKFMITAEEPPYHSRSAPGRHWGFDVDLANQIGRYLSQNISIEFTSRMEAFEALSAGRVDAVLGMDPAAPVKVRCEYTTPYLTQRNRIFILSAQGFIHKISDLKGLRVGIRQGNDAREYLKVLPAVKPVVFDRTEDAFLALVQQRISVFVGDEYESDYHIQNMDLAGVTTVGGPFMLHKRSIAVLETRPELLRELNRALYVLGEDLTLQSLKDRWFAPKIFWSGRRKSVMIGLLAGLVAAAVFLLISLIFNQRLSDLVTQRTRDVQSEHEHYENIFAHASDGISVIDPDNLTFAEANPAFCEMIGYDKAEIPHLSIADIDFLAGQPLVTGIRGAAESGESKLFEVRVVGKNRAVVDLLVHAKAFPYRGRQMVEAVIRDITEKKKLESMKDTILQDVAHELKTPIAKLAMSMELLQKKIPDESQAACSKQLDVCRRSIQRLQSTIDGILQLSRLEAQAAELKKEPLELASLIQDVFHELQVFADRKQIALRPILPGKPVIFRGSAEMIRRLFINLVHNAIKFTDKGGVTVTLETDGQFAKIAVRDEGIGLEEEDLKRIFGRFFQKSAAYEGTGVGLTICEKIVNFHNGVIWAESPGLGKGATMNVLLPVETASHSGLPG